MNKETPLSSQTDCPPIEPKWISIETEKYFAVSEEQSCVISLKQKSFEELLEEFRKIIIDFIERERLDEELVGFIRDVEKPSSLLQKITGPMKAEPNAYGREIIRYEWTTKPATPEKIHLRVPLGDWSYRPSEVSIYPLISQVGRLIAQRENFAIVKGLLSGVGKEFTNGHTKEKFREAIKWISDNEHYPDRLLIHPLEHTLLEKDGVIVPIWKLPQGFRELKSARFRGIGEGALDVYWIPQIERGTAIIYEKRAVMLERTRPQIEFDNIEHPNYLTVYEERLSGPIDERAVARMKFKAE